MIFNSLKIAKCETLFFYSIAALVIVFPVNAQTPKEADSFLEDISAGKNVDWHFSSEAESISLQDDIAELQQYDLETSEVKLDREVILRERKWDRIRNVENFLIDADIYQY